MTNLTMRILILIFLIFSSTSVYAHQCRQFLNAKHGAFLPLSRQDLSQLLLRFGIFKPEFPQKLPENIRYAQIDQISTVFMGFQMARQDLESQRFNPQMVKLMLDAQQNVVTNYLAVTNIRRQPLSTEVTQHLEKLSNVHLEISRRLSLANDSKAPSLRALSRPQSLLLQYIVNNISTLEASNVHLRLD